VLHGIIVLIAWLFLIFYYDIQFSKIITFFPDKTELFAELRILFFGSGWYRLLRGRKQ